MKRTALKRKTQLKAKAGPARKPMKRSSPKAKPTSASRDTRWRSRPYLDWVKRQPCVMCGAPADDPHHLKGVGHMSGGGLTAPDSMTMPVCRQHHDEIHATPELWPQQWEWIARTLNKALVDGVLEVSR